MQQIKRMSRKRNNYFIAKLNESEINLHMHLGLYIVDTSWTAMPTDATFKAKKPPKTAAAEIEAQRTV
ncbi:unnamed protein product [Ceratitis capitata]|uniref:(Mediterranean fruit fly) hypothetical protein n=1 Tax=Ceratitis capitata TaxID=7213 RepID=A0A811U6F2_CERCA|nr:unnamed protein product [Ceratitis capitata]